MGGTGGMGATGGTPPMPTCGDGRFENGETCDDGNRDNGDGCSRTCGVEAGYSCSAASCDASGRCKYGLPVTFRDFNASAQPSGHPDFSPGINNSVAIQGLIQTALDVDRKPVLVAPSTPGFLHGVAQFAQWYRDVQGVNAAVAGLLDLWGEPDVYVYKNRWGANGQQWAGQAIYRSVVYGGTPGTGCTCAGTCFDPCTPWGTQTQTCCAVVDQAMYDGNPLFFPLDAAPGILTETRSAARVPPQYGWAGYPDESMVATGLGVTSPIPTATAPFPSALHNFNFTSEIRIPIRHEEGTTVFEVAGDDDIWVFVNGHLAIDLGGWHPPLSGRINIDAGVVTTSTIVRESPELVVTQTATTTSFGLVVGEVYEVAIFHAERQREGSSFYFGVFGPRLQQSVCVRR